MGDKPAAGRPLAFSWLLVLCLVGLDYFSSLAYLPSIAVEFAGPLAPLAVLAVVGATLFMAVPVYCYVVGRSPNGHGATGLLETIVRGWFGKALILVLLGFIATDYVVTRSLSTADAATHLLHNPAGESVVDWGVGHRETARDWLPEFLQGTFFEFWNRQIVTAILLTILAFGFWAIHRGGITRWFMRVAAVVVGLYLSLTAVVLLCGGIYLLRNPELVQKWWGSEVPDRLGGSAADPWVVAAAVGFIVLALPRTALALSGFELSMADAPLVRGSPTDDPERPRRRIRNTRLMLLAAASIMSVFVISSVFIVTLLVPENSDPASHRALAYLAHGQPLREGIDPSAVNPLAGNVFGTLYDLSTIVILLLAGASATLSFRDFVPHFLSRFGMQLRWAHRVGVIQHLFNVVILAVTILFRAEVSHQQWAYATSVLVLLSAASVAALLDLRERFHGSWLRPFVTLPALVCCLFFNGSAALTIVTHPSGLGIALAFVSVVFATAFVSRWLRSTELRFDSFTFTDDVSKKRWEEICQLEFQVLVPHRPGLIPLADKEAHVRRRHRVQLDVPMIFVEATLGDPSDFVHRPLMRIDADEGREVIRVSGCASIAHVLAAIALEFRKVGKPPEMIFGWSDESPLAANLHFLFMGEGNIPWMVHSLIRDAEPDPLRQPRVVIG